MIRILFILLASITLQGCGIEYDGATKNIFEGTVIDETGNPLQDIEVKVWYSNGHSKDYAGIDVTDTNGNYLIIAPSAKEEIVIELQVNKSRYNDPANTFYSETSVVNITKEVVKAYNYKLSFNDIQLFPRNAGVELKLNFDNQFSQNQSIIKLNVIGMVNESYTDYDFSYINDMYEYSFSDFNFQNTLRYYVATNQTLVVKYMLSDYSVHEFQLQLGEDDIEYTITY